MKSKASLSLMLVLSFALFSEPSWAVRPPKIFNCGTLLARSQAFSGRFGGLVSPGRTSENTLFSGLSAFHVLVMLGLGADGETKVELQRFLGIDPSVSFDDVARLLGETLTAIQKPVPNSSVQVSAASFLYANSGIGVSFQAPYLSTLRTTLNGVAQALDFRDPFSLHTISGTIEKATGGAVKDIVKQLKPSGAAVLVSTLLAKGKWLQPFSKTQTLEGDFVHFVDVLGKTAKKKLPFMIDLRTVDYALADGVQVVRLPLDDQKTMLELTLPDADTSWLDYRGFRDQYLRGFSYSGKFVRTELSLQIPRFRVDFRAELRKQLRPALPRTFSEDAQFGRISNTPVFVDDVIHQAVLDVNEVGVLAAAATAVIMARPTMLRLPGTVFRADHPFGVRVIQVGEIGAVTELFRGWVANPEVGTEPTTP